MRNFMLALILTIGFAGQASATLIGGHFGGLGFYTSEESGPEEAPILTYAFPITMVDPQNDGAFAGIAGVTIGDITLDALGATADAWIIGAYSFLIEKVTVFNHDAGYDFLLKGDLIGGDLQEPSPFKVRLETIPNVPGSGLYIFARVPEPSSIALIALGIVGLIGVRRRQTLLATRVATSQS